MAIASAEDGHALAGSVFNPPDHVLIQKFLRPKLAGLPIRGRHNIHDVDAYSVSPDELVDKRQHAEGTDDHDGKRGHWYFFTPVRRHQTKNGRLGTRQRAVGGGYTWHSEHEKPIDDDKGRCIGYKTELSFLFKESPKAKPTRFGWCMTEYRLDDDAAGLVLCKVYLSGHKKKTTYGSVIKAMADFKKRKAMADCNKSEAMADCKKRKAGDDPHPDAPRPRAPRRQDNLDEPAAELQDIERRWLYSDDQAMPATAGVAVHPAGFSFQERQAEIQEIERWLLTEEDDALPAGAVDDGSVDPAGFYADILQDVEEFQQQRLAEDDGIYEEEVTYEALYGDDDMELVACPAPAPAFVSCAAPSSHMMAKCSNATCEICIQQMVTH